MHEVVIGVHPESLQLGQDVVGLEGLQVPEMANMALNILPNVQNDRKFTLIYYY